MQKRQMVSGKDAACQLGRSIWTLRSWAYKGIIASHKIGARLMFDQAEIDRVIRESERPRLKDAASLSPKELAYTDTRVTVMGAGLD